MKKHPAAVVVIAFFAIVAAAVVVYGQAVRMITVYDALEGKDVEVETVERTADQWRDELSPAAFHVLREQGTERPYTSGLNDEKRDGVFTCAACGNHLFDSKTKFESGTGWPSFYQPVDPRNIGTREDRSWFTVRTEIHCARCGGHQGHVFSDGPEPTGLRYCINGVALGFVPR